MREDPTPVRDDEMQAMLAAKAPGVSFLLRRGPRFDDPATAPLQWEHARNMFSLLRAGVLAQVVPLMDGTDVLGFGRFARGDRDEAVRVLADDPAVRAGRLTVQVLASVSFDASELKG